MEDPNEKYEESPEGAFRQAEELEGKLRSEEPKIDAPKAEDLVKDQGETPESAEPPAA